MSVIVAIKKDNIIYMACDSQVSVGPYKSYLHSENNYKIWKVKNSENCLMAGVGRSREICITRLIDDLVDELAELHGQIDYEYVVKYIVPHIREVMWDLKYLKEDETTLESSYLFAYKDKLFHIYGDGCVFEITDEIAIGSGEENALGSLEATKKNKNVEQRLIEAVKAACNHNLYVSGDIILTNTKSCEFKEV